ncbi:MAG: DUF5069 domain-containing protein [Candidatus Baltobacteraceae bacterium]
MEKIVPTISSSVRGPLGACHLPRLWLKIVLHATGRLPEGYRHGSGGFDGMTIEGLGLDGDAFVAYVESERPTYLACEAWVRAHATRLDAASLEEHNRIILERVKTEEAAAEQLREIGAGVPPGLRHAVSLNDLDDWTSLHRQVTAPVV